MLGNSFLEDRSGGVVGAHGIRRFFAAADCESLYLLKSTFATLMTDALSRSILDTASSGKLKNLQLLEKALSQNGYGWCFFFLFL